MTETKIPEVITKKIYVSIGIGGHNLNNIGINDFDRQNYPSSEVITILIKEITLKLPQNIVIKDKILHVLEQEKTTLMAKHHMALKVIDDKIANLLAIDYQGETA